MQDTASLAYAQTLQGHPKAVGYARVSLAHISPLHFSEPKPSAALPVPQLGSGNDIREGVQIHRSSAADLVTKVGSRNLIMGGCHVAHDCHMGSHNIMANNTLLAGHVQV